MEQEDTREVINITELNAEIKRIVAREQVLRDEIDKIIAEIEAEWNKGGLRMRGDAERKCLEAVQRCIFISSPDRKETAYTVSEDEFLK